MTWTVIEKGMSLSNLKQNFDKDIYIKLHSKKNIFAVILFFLFSPNLWAVEITNSSNFAGLINITVALEDLNKQANVRCIVYNMEGKPIAQGLQWINGVGTIMIMGPSNVREIKTKCSEQK